MSTSAFVNLTSSDGTTATTKVGSLHSVDGSDYIYCKSGGAIAQYAACTLSNAGVAVEATTTTSGAKPTTVVVPQFAVAAADEYFWGWNGGQQALSDWKGNPFKVLAKTLAAASVKIYTHATAGYVDDTATDLIEGLVLTETVGGSDASATCIGVSNFKTNVQD